MRKILLENFGMKISAVILAIVLWFFVTSRGQSEISINIPVELKNVPQGLESVRQSVKSVDVSIKGQERLLKSLKPSDIRAYLDLSKAKKGKGTYYLNKDDVRVPSTITVTNIYPASVWVVLEETASRTVPVQPSITGIPRAGFFISSVEYKPKSVTIEGVRSEVSNVKFLRTETVDVSDLNETYVQDVKLDTAGRNIRTDVQEINVKVFIKGRK